MSVWKAPAGMVTACLTGAEPGVSLQAISQRDITLYQIEWLDDLTVRFRCARTSVTRIQALCQNRGDHVGFSNEDGLIFRIQKLKRRKVLLIGCLIFFLLTALLPTRIFFFEVQGNAALPEELILEEAERCGIGFGVSRREIRSEKMKNALLEAMPELKWAAINTTGCRAVISVREREIPATQPVTAGISSIVAARDGFITSCTVTKGSSLCTPGQTVVEGELLISGYTDCGRCTLATGAEGEIFAQTNRSVCVLSPRTCLRRGEVQERQRRYSLLLGKKRINLWKDSGIWDATCGRMYEEYYIPLPGGFQLPLGIGIETLTRWTCTEEPVLFRESELLSWVRGLVLRETVAGEILAEEFRSRETENLWVLEGSFRCHEMISRVITEEIGETNGKTD